MLLKNKDYFLKKWQELQESDNPLRRHKVTQFSKIITETGGSMNLILLYMLR